MNSIEVGTLVGSFKQIISLLNQEDVCEGEQKSQRDVRRS